MRINCSFVGLTNVERCLIYSLRVEKHCGSEKNDYFQINEHMHIQTANG